MTVHFWCTTEKRRNDGLQWPAYALENLCGTDGGGHDSHSDLRSLVTCPECLRVLKQASPTEDMVNHPKHYTQGGVECIDAIEAATAHLNGNDAFLTGQVIKYMWRWKQKNGVEDLSKAQWYLNRLIAKQEE